MSLLSSTQGTPERVWSLINLLAAHGGSLSRDEIFGWLSPPFTAGNEPRPITGERDGQAIGAATSLDLVRREGQLYSLTGAPPPSYPAFADQVHGRLSKVDNSDPDFVVLETFAWVVAEVERRQSTTWVLGSSNEFADAVEHAIGGQESSGERRFNSTKLAAWRRWIFLLGLGSDLPGNVVFYPYITERLGRELSVSGLPTDTDLPVDSVLRCISQSMPYLDGGTLFSQTASRLALRLPPRKLSRVLSTALRDLHDEGLISLRVRGDSSDRFELALDGHHTINTVQTISLKG